MSTIWNWREQGEVTTVEFSVKPHDIKDDTVHLWVDPPEDGSEALASIDVTLEDAEKLGNELLAAVEAQRGKGAEEPLTLLLEDDMLVCPHCGASDVVERAVESEFRHVWLSNTYTIDGRTYGSLDAKSIDVETRESSFECDKCHNSVAMPEGIA